MMDDARPRQGGERKMSLKNPKELDDNPLYLDGNYPGIFFPDPEMRIKVNDEATLQQSADPSQPLVVQITEILDDKGENFRGIVKIGTCFKDKFQNYNEGELILFPIKKIFGINKRARKVI